jgi:hypothetical protein
MKRRTEPPKAARRTGPCLALLAGLLLAFSCDRAEDPTGGETHFLTACGPGVQCGGELACLCGVCTRSCAVAGDCRELARAQCMPKPDTGVCADAPAQSFCDAGCTTDADCAAISGAHRCQNGRCRAGSSGASGAGGTSGAEGGAGPGGAGGGAACPSGEVDANQVLVIGDSFFGATHRITAYLEDLARAAGALSSGERYRDNSSVLANSLALGGNGIAAQYAAAAAETDVKVVIMNGGGADVLRGECAMPTAECPVLVDASSAATELLSRMADDGVEHVVYAFYPDPVDAGLREKMDALRPLIELACETSSVPCHWLDLRPTFAGRYEDYIQPDGMNPTAAGSEATAGAIWATLRASCIAQ